MAQALEDGDVDVAVMLSEGAVARVANGAPIKVVGTYVQSPLRWGIHVKKGSPLKTVNDLKGKIFGVSRMLSGSHLMAHVLANQLGWDPATDAPLKVVGTLDGAREAMASGEIDTWLWEKFTTKFLVDQGEWDIIGEVPTPWPCFLFMASEKSIVERKDEIRNLVEVTKRICDEFKANEGDSTFEYVKTHHAVGSRDDAEEWLTGTNWACAPEVQRHTLEKTQEALVTIGQLKEPVSLEQLFEPSICRLVS
jgi:ABC-type nitrate/sulfonate/bicarbonate transport system substrate-binding protein